jgi:hypothetical protein
MCVCVWVCLCVSVGSPCTGFCAEAKKQLVVFKSLSIVRQERVYLQSHSGTDSMTVSLTIIAVISHNRLLDHCIDDYLFFEMKVNSANFCSFNRDFCWMCSQCVVCFSFRFLLNKVRVGFKFKIKMQSRFFQSFLPSFYSEWMPGRVFGISLIRQEILWKVFECQKQSNTFFGNKYCSA